MTKNILLPLNDDIHEEWSQIKGETTWKQVLELGIEAKNILNQIERETTWQEILELGIEAKKKIENKTPKEVRVNG